MVPRRHVPPPPVRRTQRSTLEPATCLTVDTVLKQLKTCSRRLQAALASHRTELQVLERLYYKGKNQHRSALFWQRVAEMRRLGERVDEMHMGDVVESLRVSFWGEQQPSLGTLTAKMLKGPWTHYPDANALLFVMERCSACCMLIDRARERLAGAYESFTLMMQTGAFLQLILVLAAVASRMSILLSEVRAALEVSWAAAYKCLTALFPSENKSVRALLVNPDEKDNASTPRTDVPSKSRSRIMSVVSTPVEPHDEDLGSTLARPRPVTDLPTQAQSSSSVLDTPPLPDTDVILRAEAFSLSSELSVGHSTETIRPSHSTAAQVSIIAPAASSTTSVFKRRKVDGEGPKQTKKKRKKRDEIDDIFGF